MVDSSYLCAAEICLISEERIVYSSYLNDSVLLMYLQFFGKFADITFHVYKSKTERDASAPLCLSVLFLSIFAHMQNTLIQLSNNRDKRCDALVGGAFLTYMKGLQSMNGRKLNAIDMYENQGSNTVGCTCRMKHSCPT